MKNLKQTYLGKGADSTNCGWKLSRLKTKFYFVLKKLVCKNGVLVLFEANSSGDEQPRALTSLHTFDWERTSHILPGVKR